MRPALFNILTARVPEADLLIDTMTVRPQGNRAFLISDTIRRLKAADVWAKLDVLWMLAAHDAQAGRLNWKAPASFALTEVNSPTFTADRGYAGNGTTSYLNTGWDAATNGVNFSQNSASVFAWNRTSRGTALLQLVGSESFGTVADISILPRYTGDTTILNVQSETAMTPSIAASDGFWAANRSGASAQEGYRNGASVSSGAQTSLATTTIDVYFIARNINGTADRFSTDQIAAAGLGSSLTAAQHGALYAITQSHLQAVGASV